MELVVKGAEELEELARALKTVGAVTLRRELLRTVQRARGTFPRVVRSSARSRLPQRGGFAGLVAASRVTSVTRVQGDRVGVRVTVSSRYNIRSADRGRIRHPLFGAGGRRYGQTIPAGWLTKPIEALADTLQTEANRSLRTFADRHLSN